MKFLLISAAVLLVCLVQNSSAKSIPQEWEDFKIKYNRQFTLEEEKDRKEIFFYNLQRIQEENEKYQNGYWGNIINGWSDRTTAEFKARKGYKPPTDKQ